MPSTTSEELFETLLPILRKAPHDDEVTTTFLSDWNDRLEAVLLSHRRTAAAATNETTITDMQCLPDHALLNNVSQQLQQCLLRVFRTVGGGGDKNEEEDEEDELTEKQVLQCWRKHDDDDADITAQDDIERRKQVLRASQNVLRWYLQIYYYYYSSQQPQSQQRNDDDFWKGWKSRDMLELYVCWITQLPELPQKRYASQLLFYSTFNVGMAPSSNTETLTESYMYLVEACHLPLKLLEQLVIVADTDDDSSCSNHQLLPLQLSLVRNVHNALTSYPSTRTAVSQVSLDNKTPNQLAPWVTTTSSISYPSVFCDLLSHCLEGVPIPEEEQDEDQAGTRVKNVNEDVEDDERRTELVLEILRSVYVLRVNLNDDQRWRSLLLDKILQTPNNNELDCQLAAIHLLMDVTPSNDVWNLRNHTEILLHILQRQIDTVVGNQYVDDRAAAALTPSLAVLHKFCTADDPEFRHSVKTRIFPNTNDDDDDTTSGIDDSRTKAPMSPTDAPAGTLRGQLVQLLTWPQSLVKRLAGELLWTLCDGRRDEFVRRVGMGNALPMLNLKGHVQLPPNVHS